MTARLLHFMCCFTVCVMCDDDRYHGTDVAVMTARPPTAPGKATPDYATAFAKVGDCSAFGCAFVLPPGVLLACIQVLFLVCS